MASQFTHSCTTWKFGHGLGKLGIQSKVLRTTSALHMIYCRKPSKQWASRVLAHIKMDIVTRLTDMLTQVFLCHIVVLPVEVSADISLCVHFSVQDSEADIPNGTGVNTDQAMQLMIDIQTNHIAQSVLESNRSPVNSVEYFFIHTNSSGQIEKFVPSLL